MQREYCLQFVLDNRAAPCPGALLAPAVPPPGWSSGRVRQEIWGYLLSAWAVSALISDATAAAWIDPGRVSFTKAVRIVRRAVGPAFPP